MLGRAANAREKEIARQGARGPGRQALLRPRQCAPRATELAAEPARSGWEQRETHPNSVAPVPTSHAPAKAQSRAEAERSARSLPQSAWALRRSSLKSLDQRSVCLAKAQTGKFAQPDFLEQLPGERPRCAEG